MNSMKRKTTSSRRGVTLIETMVALVVLAIGIAAIFSMVAHVSKANRTMLLQTRSVDAFAQIAAEIQNAQCDFDPGTGTPYVDPGFTTTVPMPIDEPIDDSAIQSVGVTDGSGPLPATVPPMSIAYAVVPVPAPTPGGIPGYEIEVQITEINPISRIGDGTRRYPIRKLCNPRLDATRRGEFK